ncbi:hypothetical protein JCM10212_005093 [Sporobolomyces blumeae]
MATYDNGLYTPWTPADEATVAAAPATTAAATSTTVWWTPETTTAAPTTTTTTTTTTSQAPTTTTTTTTTSSSSTTTTAPSSSSTSFSTTSSSSSSTTTPAQTSSTSLSSTSSSHVSTSASSSAALVGPSSVVSAAQSGSDHAPTFKITYLLPVFIIVPCVCLFLLLAWSYGKYWARPRLDGEASGRPQDQPGFWDGAYKSIGRKDDRKLEKGDGDGNLDEKGGLVPGKDWAGIHDDVESATPKRNRSSKWTNWLPPLGRGPSTRSNRSTSSSGHHSMNHVPFVSVSYASLQGDKPFVPPSQSYTNLGGGFGRSASQTSDHNRGWGWGAKPRGTSSALRVMNADIDDADDFDSRQHLTADAATVGGGWGTSSRKYRAKKTGSVSSRLSDKIMSKLSPGGLSPSAMAASPSVYSPQFSPTPPGGGTYAELGAGDEDEELLDEKRDVDLDAYLGESRVGHGQLANRFLNGDPHAMPPPSSSQRGSSRGLPAGAAPAPRDEYYARQGGNAPHSSSLMTGEESVPAFAVTLPSAPPRSQISPKKSKTSLLRPPPPESPRATPPPQLLFGYDSPPPPSMPTSNSRGPLPMLPGSRSRSNLGSNDPFTSPPARVPFRSQPPPQLSRPSRANTSTPFSPETAPGLFFASPPLGSPPSSHGHHAGPYNPHQVIGSPMPDFQPGALRASESAFSISGVDKLIYADPSTAILTHEIHKGVPSESRTGLKEFAEKERNPHKSRKDEIEQLRRSVGTSIAPKDPPSASKPPPAPANQALPSSQSNVSGFKKVSTRPLGAGSTAPRESLGFDPVFSESPTLPPLQHPSKVRAAIESLESKSASGHSKSSSVDSSRSGHGGRPVSYDHKAKPRVERMPSPPVSQKLERSTTTLGRSRDRKHHGFDSDGEHDEDAIAPRQHARNRTTNDDFDAREAEAIRNNRRVSMLLLHRSRTQSGPARSPDTGSSETDHDLASTEEGGASVDAHQARPALTRPLSSDPERLGQMLRRKSTGANLGSGAEGTGVVVGEDGNVGGGILAAMTRRSGIFD